jgi:hypothetical protein
MLPCDVRPQRSNADRAEQMALMAVTVVAESGKRLLSLRYPKKEDAKMPGMLKRVSRSVEEVWDRRVTSRAYVGRYVCGIPYPHACKIMAML